MTNFELKCVIAVLPARDLAASVAFYHDERGFSQYFDMGNYVGVGRGPIKLHLDGSTTGATPVSVRVDVGGVDAIHEEIGPRGIVMKEEPLETKPWGTRQFSVLDPTGNRITFTENVSG